MAQLSKISSSGRFVLRARGSSSLNQANTAAKTQLVTTGVMTDARNGFAMYASPDAALPAGFAGGLVFGSTDQLNVGMVNLTAGALDPAAVTWRIQQWREEYRMPPAGRPLGNVQTFSLDHGAIAALSVVEQTVAMSGFNATVGPTRPLVASPRTALPAGLLLSHARISATGVAAIGLGNMTAAPIDPAAIEWDLYTDDFPRIRKSPTGPKRIFLSAQTSLDFGPIAAESVQELAVAVPGARVGDVAFASPLVPDPTIAYSHARVTANDTVAVAVANVTGAPIDPAAGDWTVTVIRRL